MPGGLIEKDSGWAALGDLFKKFSSGKTAVVGIQGDKASLASPEHGSMTNVELGAIHEYGTLDKRIPERSFLRSTYAENETWALSEVKKISTEEFFSGKDPTQSLRMAGEEFRKKVLEKIKSGIQPSLADSTIKRKRGETTPLIDTGQLWNSISAEVRDRKSVTE